MEGQVLLEGVLEEGIKKYKIKNELNEKSKFYKKIWKNLLFCEIKCNQKVDREKRVCYNLKKKD